MAETMRLDVFRAEVLKAAKAAGLEQAEIYTVRADSLRVLATGGQVADYAVADKIGVSLRGVYEGRMGYCSTQALDAEAIAQLIEGVKESAALCEGEQEESIYPGDAHYEKAECFEPALEAVPAEKKVALARALEVAVAQYDARLTCNMAGVSTSSGTVALENTYGLRLENRDNAIVAHVSVAAREGEKVASGGAVRAVRDIEKIDVEEMVREAGDEAIAGLEGAPVASGVYDVVIKNSTMVDLLSTFSGIFSAENAQQGLSLLKDREGSVIAAPCVTLIDDPLMEGGFATCPFDAEGVAAYKKTVVDAGRLTTLLHNRKTAAKAGVKSTGNAAKESYASPVKVAPSNFYLQKGDVSFDALLAQLGDGLLITDVSGLHAGANAVSGDFSLLCSGFVVKDGKQGRAVKQITMAGNFLKMLMSVAAVGDDLKFPGDPIGSPSVLVKGLSIAGK